MFQNIPKIIDDSQPSSENGQHISVLFIAYFALEMVEIIISDHFKSLDTPRKYISLKSICDENKCIVQALVRKQASQIVSSYVHAESALSKDELIFIEPPNDFTSFFGFSFDRNQLNMGILQRTVCCFIEYHKQLTQTDESLVGAVMASLSRCPTLRRILIKQSSQLNLLNSASAATSRDGDTNAETTLLRDLAALCIRLYDSSDSELELIDAIAADQPLESPRIGLRGLRSRSSSRSPSNQCWVDGPDESTHTQKNKDFTSLSIATDTHSMVGGDLSELAASLHAAGIGLPPTYGRSGDKSASSRSKPRSGADSIGIASPHPPSLISPPRYTPDERQGHFAFENAAEDELMDDMMPAYSPTLLLSPADSSSPVSSPESSPDNSPDGSPRNVKVPSKITAVPLPVPVLEGLSLVSPLTRRRTHMASNQEMTGGTETASSLHAPLSRGSASPHAPYSLPRKISADDVFVSPRKSIPEDNRNTDTSTGTNSALLIRRHTVPHLPPILTPTPTTSGKSITISTSSCGSSPRLPLKDEMTTGTPPRSPYVKPRPLPATYSPRLADSPHSVSGSSGSGNNSNNSSGDLRSSLSRNNSGGRNGSPIAPISDRGVAHATFDDDYMSDSSDSESEKDYTRHSHHRKLSYTYGVPEKLSPAPAVMRKVIGTSGGSGNSGSPSNRREFVRGLGRFVAETSSPRAAVPASPSINSSMRVEPSSAASAVAVAGGGDVLVDFDDSGSESD